MPANAWRRPFEWAGDTRRHEFLYDAQAIFKILAAMSFVAVLLFSFNGWPGTLFFGIVFLLTSGLWMTSALLEHRARRGLAGPTTEGEYARAHAESGPDAEREREIARRAARAGTRLALEILAALLMVAIGAAVLLFDRATIGIGIVLAFVWLLVFGAPYWAAAVLDRQAEDRDRDER